jgi:hypothetical protein
VKRDRRKALPYPNRAFRGLPQNFAPYPSLQGSFMVKWYFPGFVTREAGEARASELEEQC